MTDARALASVACLLGDESRAAMCLALLDGGAWTVSELAEAASVGRAAASEHVARLVAGGLVTTETQGRHKFVRLAGPRVAELVELLSGFGTPAPARSLAAVRERTRLAAARTCYDHLAGQLGVALADALVTAGHAELASDAGIVTDTGMAFLDRIGIDVKSMLARGSRKSSRVLCRPCLDWSERRPHLAGMVGAAICTHSFDQGWIRPIPGTRAVTITPRGQHVFRTEFGAELA